MIYFFKEIETGNIKIGVTKSPKTLLQRIQSANTLNSGHVCVVGLTDGSFKEEKTLHRLFNEYRLKNEWFSAEENLIEYIDFSRKEEIYIECILEESKLTNYIEKNKKWN